MDLHSELKMRQGFIILNNQQNMSYNDEKGSMRRRDLEFFLGLLVLPFMAKNH